MMKRASAARIAAMAAALPVVGAPIARAQSSNESVVPAAPAAAPTASSQLPTPGYAPSPEAQPLGYYAPPTYYPPRPAGPPPGLHEHDGFYLRLATGPSMLHASWHEGGNDWSISGLGIALAMALGVSITPNLVLYGEITGSVAIDPSQRCNGVATTLTDYDVSLAGRGVGAAYYLVPANLYFSGTLAVFRLTKGYRGPSSGQRSDSHDGAIITNNGIGAAFIVGREWWLSTNWGLGLAGIVHVASMKVTNDDSRATAGALSLLLSATYN